MIFGSPWLSIFSFPHSLRSLKKFGVAALKYHGWFLLTSPFRSSPTCRRILLFCSRRASLRCFLMETVSMMGLKMRSTNRYDIIWFPGCLGPSVNFFVTVEIGRCCFGWQYWWDGCYSHIWYWHKYHSGGMLYSFRFAYFMLTVILLYRVVLLYWWLLHTRS